VLLAASGDQQFTAEGEEQDRDPDTGAGAGPTSSVPGRASTGDPAPGSGMLMLILTE
jgi:hypothetical protein